MQELINKLPSRLQERTRCLLPVEIASGGEFVLYWMRTAVRAEENAALDVAIELANRLGRFVFVYHCLSERYPYASDRHHAFVLEGARDVQQQFAEKCIAYAFHLERSNHRGPHLRTLAERACLVVTEEMPVDPLRRWTATLAASSSRPVVAVDTSCIVPMRLVGKAYDRAFEYRNATKTQYAERIGAEPEIVESEFLPKPISRLPFEPVDLQTANIADLIGQCDIDHSIANVPHTVGGTTAGYERWNNFKTHRLAEYARARNDALGDGVSRMSAYLHYGMVSPMRIAREVGNIDNDGAEKYLDELLIWRELAYAFCFYTRDHGRISSLPDWAISTLAERESDERPAYLSWETLARGKTGDALWDAAQRSLLLHGELHNNVRMTWGKSILRWTKNSKHALSMIIDLNHRYALDGRDPASFGGILWCLGQFDRPFKPPQPIFGTARNRSTKQHAERLDVPMYQKKTSRALHDPMPSVAVVGAGMSGLICARTLADHGFHVTVFEKSRGVGGRMSTRRTNDGLRFDHGAQYFTARDKRFQRYVKSWIHDGVVAPWRGRIAVVENGQVKQTKCSTNRYVATPGMNSVCKHLADELDVRFERQISPIARVSDKWRLNSVDGDELGEFDMVIVSAPAPQAAKLLEPVPQLAKLADSAKMQGCWALMIALSHPIELEFDAAFIDNSPVSWISRNSSKPSRDSALETWVVHASAKWSDSHIEDKKEEVAEILLSEFWNAIGPARASESSDPVYETAHRWRFAIPAAPLSNNCLFDDDLNVGACGDWCAGPRVEGAFLSGLAAAGRAMGSLGRNKRGMQQR